MVLITEAMALLSNPPLRQAATGKSLLNEDQYFDKQDLKYVFVFFKSICVGH